MLKQDGAKPSEAWLHKSPARQRVADRLSDEQAFDAATSTDYVYNGELTRKAKYGFRLHPLDGTSNTAPLYDKYYQSAAGCQPLHVRPSGM